jgi:hypothetical protein
VTAARTSLYHLSRLSRFGLTDLSDEIPEELKDPNWLTNELDGTNELIRAIEAEKIDGIPPKASHQEIDMSAIRENKSNEQNGANKDTWANEANKLADVRTNAYYRTSNQKSAARKAKEESAIQEKRMHVWEKLSKELSKDREWAELGRKARELEELDKGAPNAPTYPS